MARLKAAILSKELIPEPDTNPLAHFVDRPINHYVRVSRENLKAYAEAQGERPMFLFGFISPDVASSSPAPSSPPVETKPEKPPG